MQHVAARDSLCSPPVADLCQTCVACTHETYLSLYDE